MEQLIKDIQKSIKNNLINCGGCIHFAYYMSKELTKRNIKHKIVFFGKYPHIKDVTNNGTSHAAIKIDDYYFDAINYSINRDNIWSFYLGYKEYVGTKSLLEKINVIRKKKDIWNCEYDRHYNSYLSKTIKKNFENYDNRRKGL